MSDMAWTGLVAVATGIITAAPIMLGLLLSHRATMARMKKETMEVVGHVTDLKKEVNGRVTELVKSTADAATLKGKEEGREEEKQDEQERKDNP